MEPTAAPFVCHFPAQELLSLIEMRRFLDSQRLPDDFGLRVQTSLSHRDLAESPNLSYAHSSPFPMIALLGWEEMAEYLLTSQLPVGFELRVGVIAAEDCCLNCEGRHCMGCVLREYEHECEPDCPSCCEPPGE